MVKKQDQPTLKTNRTLLWGSAFIKIESIFRNFVHWQLFGAWDFPALYLHFLTNEIEDKHATPTFQGANSLRQ